MARATTPKVTEQVFTFSSLIKQSGDLPNKQAARAGDPLTIAKAAILKALDEQKGYLSLVESGQTLPKSKKGTKTVSTWFTKTPEGYWTSIRYGQLSIPVNGQTGFLVGEAGELTAFYEAVKAASRGGELDEVISDMQATRSQALRKARSR